MSKLVDVLNKLVQAKRITDVGLGAKPPATGGYGGLRAKPPAAERFFVIFGKKLFYYRWITSRTRSEPFERTGF